MKLTYTYIRLDDGRRLIVPNERLAQSSVVNHTIVDPRVQVEVSVWLPPDADLDKRDRADRGRGGGRHGDRGRGGQGGRAAQRHDLGRRARRARHDRRRAARAHGFAGSASTVTILSRGLLSVVRPPNFAMTHRQRKSRRRRRHTGRSTVLLGARRPRHRAPSSACCRWPATCWRSPPPRPTSTELKPADKGQLSVVYAADGSRLGFVQSDVLRRVVPWGDIPVDLRRATVAIEDERFYKHGGVDFNAIVRAGVQEPRVRQDRAGRLDDHPAARARALHQGPEAQLHPQDPRGQAGLRARGRALEDVDPPQLPELSPVRDGGRPHGDRRRGRGGHVLRQARQGARPVPSRRCSPACRRRRPSTTRSATRRPRSTRRNEVLRQMVDNGYITAGRGRERPSQRGLGLKHGTPLHPAPRALLLRLRAGAS